MKEDEARKAKQDEMLRMASQQSGPEAGILGAVNDRLWPDCAVCAGWRGLAIGLAFGFGLDWLIGVTARAIG